jgi:hypothetical protein
MAIVTPEKVTIDVAYIQNRSELLSLFLLTTATLHTEKYGAGRQFSAAATRKVIAPGSKSNIAGLGAEAPSSPTRSWEAKD